MITFSLQLNLQTFPINVAYMYSWAHRGSIQSYVVQRDTMLANLQTHDERAISKVEFWTCISCPFSYIHKQNLSNSYETLYLRIAFCEVSRHSMIQLNLSFLQRNVRIIKKEHLFGIQVRAIFAHQGRILLRLEEHSFYFQYKEKKMQ